MGDKKPKNGQIGLGEINTIRDILMGEQNKHFELQLMELRQELDSLRNNVSTGMTEIKSILKQNNKNVRNEMLSKVVELENRMVKQNDKVSTKFKKDRADQTAQLSKLFLKIGKELSD